MKTDKFIKLIKAGERTAKLFALNITLFLDTVVLYLQDYQTHRIEGYDFEALVVRWTRVNMNADIANISEELSLSTNNGECLSPKLVRGGIEIKTIQSGKSLHRNDIGDMNCITVPFALWDGTADDNKGNTIYTRAKFGWLRRLIQPEWLQNSAQPMVLAFILEGINEQGKPRPFASIVFEDFEALAQRLIEYGQENGLNLMHWEKIPVGEAAKNFNCGSLLFSANLWLVPLDVLVDIARITVIGEPPMFYKNGSCTKEIQAKRYQYLCEHAEAQIPYEELRLDGEIAADTPQHPVFKLLQLDTARIQST